MLHVVVCDDDRDQAFLMQLWLAGEPDVDVVRICQTRELAVLVCESVQVDVLVMDYSMPGDPWALLEVVERCPATPILLWTGYERTDLPIEVVVKVSGVLVKDIVREVAVAAVRRVAEYGVPRFVA